MSKDKKARKRHKKMMRKVTKMLGKTRRAYDELQTYARDSVTYDAQKINIDFDNIKKKMKPFKFNGKGVLVESTNDEVHYEEAQWPVFITLSDVGEICHPKMTVICPDGVTKEQLTPIVEAMAKELNKLRDGK